MVDRTYARHLGQGMVEYTGMILVGAIFAVGLISSASQVMPTVFDLLLQNNETALSDEAPDLSLRHPLNKRLPDITERGSKGMGMKGY